MKAFGEIDELPFADALVPFGDRAWEHDGDYDAVHINGLTLEGVQAPYARFLECAITRTAFEGGKLRGARLSEVWLRDVRLVGTEMMETGWQDAALVASVLAGVQAFGASLQRVVFSGCKLDSVNLRGATLVDVEFNDCMLRDVDLGGATIKRASFQGCTLSGVELGGAKLQKVDLRGAQLGLAGGHEALRGAIIDTAQLIDLAPALAKSIGITVRDT